MVIDWLTKVARIAAGNRLSNSRLPMWCCAFAGLLFLTGALLCYTAVIVPVCAFFYIERSDGGGQGGELGKSEKPDFARKHSIQFSANKMQEFRGFFHTFNRDFRR